ncbi:MAG: hypothetical protein V1787_02350 [Candidatus Micrarchaeota archaeon]
MPNVTVSQLKRIAPSLGHEHGVRDKNYQMVPMFLPTDVTSKGGKGVIKVVTRQGFMNEGISDWVMMNTTRGMTMLLAIVALMLFPVNIYLAALAGIGAGYAYGKYRFKEWLIKEEYRHRWMLEGT